MAKFALIILSGPTDTGRRYDITQGEADTRNAYLTLNKDRKLVPVVDAAPPAYDPATEKLEDAPDTVTVTAITRNRQVVALTQEEQDAYADTVLRATERQSAGTGIGPLRTRADDLRSLTIPAGNLREIRNDLAFTMNKLADLIRAQNVDS